MILHEELKKEFYLKPIVERANRLLTDTKEAVILPSYTRDGAIFNIKQDVLETSLETVPKLDCAYFEDGIDIASMFNIYEIQITDKLAAYNAILNLIDVPDVYGIIVVTSQGKVNPLHFLAPELYLVKKLVVYTTKNPQQIDQDILAKELEQIATIDTILSQHRYAHKEQEATAFRVEVSGSTPRWSAFPGVNIESQDTIILPAGETEEHCIVPHFFVTRGIVAPFYGISHINMSKRKGYKVSAMRSANISVNNSVCIGSLSSSKYDSYRCLNFSNLDSPYRRDIMPIEYMSIAEAHKQYAKIKIQGILNESN